jgi:hypothetical protein
VKGLFTIQAADVRVDGFWLANPGASTGILVKTAGNNARILHNIIDGIGGASFSENTQAVYLEHGPDGVWVIGNRMRHIVGDRTSNGGVFIGDSTATDPSVDILIAGNTISDVQSLSRGAYGIHVNNGAKATGYTRVKILGNSISGLSGGGWTHAIGLEGDTPDVVVRLNSISNVAAGTTNRVAVFFEDNRSFATGHVNQNNFDVTPAAAGIYVVPSPAGSTAKVDGTCNWWGHGNGPGPAGPNPLGAGVGPNVTYSPWLTDRAPSRCGPPPPPRCRPGERDDGDGDVDETDSNGRHRAHFTFDECDGGRELSHRDQERRVDFHSDAATTSVPTFDAALPVATTTGQGWNNGMPVSYTLVVTDLGIGPGTDVYALTLRDSSGVIYAITGKLTAGNISVRR